MKLKKVYNGWLSKDYEKLWELLLKGYSFICLIDTDDIPLTIEVSWFGYNPKPSDLFIRSSNHTYFLESFYNDEIKRKFLEYCNKDHVQLSYFLPPS
jgi:hypothetical protein